MVEESKMYPLITDYLMKNLILSEGEQAESYQEVQMFYGHIRCAADIVIYKWKEITNEEDQLPMRELAEMHVCECKPYLYTYRAFGQLLHYKNIIDLYYNSGHFLAYNEDFCGGVKAFWDRNGRFPKYWIKHLETDRLEQLSPSLKLYLYLVLLYDRKYVDKQEFDDTVAFHQRCLNSFMNRKIGLLTIYHPSKYVYRKKESKPIEIARMKGAKPKSYFEADTACIVRKRKTWRYCPWFVDGKFWRCPYRSERCIGSRCYAYREY